eukprot:3999027-Pyramimonas_sp.AAC.1
MEVRHLEAMPGIEGSAVIWWQVGCREDRSGIQIPSRQMMSTPYLFGDIWPFLRPPSVRQVSYFQLRSHEW